MYNTENRPHISSLNFIKVEMFTEKVIQKGGMEEFLQWVKSK